MTLPQLLAMRALPTVKAGGPGSGRHAGLQLADEKKFIMPGFKSSLSVFTQKLEPPDKPNAHVYAIHVPMGSPALYIDHKGGSEPEPLLNRGSRFTYVNHEKLPDGTTLLHVKHSEG